MTGYLGLKSALGGIETWDLKKGKSAGEWLKSALGGIETQYLRNEVPLIF